MQFNDPFKAEVGGQIAGAPGHDRDFGRGEAAQATPREQERRGPLPSVDRTILPPPVPLPPPAQAPGLPENRGAVNPRTGERYLPSGTGVINPRTGEYYPPSGGGYINPRTGEYFPAVDR